jgi:hypothetical protein
MEAHAIEEHRRLQRQQREWQCQREQEQQDWQKQMVQQQVEWGTMLTSGDADVKGPTRMARGESSTSDRKSALLAQEKLPPSIPPEEGEMALRLARQAELRGIKAPPRTQLSGGHVARRRGNLPPTMPPGEEKVARRLAMQAELRGIKAPPRA